MKLIPFEINSGAENMRIDSQMLDDSIRYNSKEPIFRLYAWKPFCVSLGRNQKDDFLDKDFLKANNIDFVRRLTGGRALLHADEITYSCVFPVEYLNNGENVVQSYKEISQILIDAFKGFNAPFELTTYEALTKCRNILNDNGIVITNIISSLEGEKSDFIKYEYTTYKKIFDDVKIFKVGDEENTKEHNLILMGIKGNTNINEGKYEEYKNLLDTEVKDYESDKPIVTDDYCPIGN